MPYTHSVLTLTHIVFSSYMFVQCTYRAHVKSQDVLNQCIAPAVVTAEDTVTIPVAQVKTKTD